MVYVVIGALEILNDDDDDDDAVFVRPSVPLVISFYKY